MSYKIGRFARQRMLFCTATKAVLHGNGARFAKRFMATSLSVAVITLVVMTLHSCARMGNPDGGWFDDTPPRVVRTSPSDRGTKANQKRVTIEFDEYIKLDDPTNKVVVSPPQLEMPEIKASGKKIVIDLIDSLKSNVTYTIDFSDAISDNNEGNPMGNYTYSFSTGEQIDTFEVSGTVLDASNLEPVKGILVGLYANLSDTAFTTLPLQRVSRTNGSGRFIIRGVAQGDYRIYALQDMDGDYKFSQKSEMVAYSHDIFSPTSAPDIRQDTIWRDSLRIDSIIQTRYTHFRPDDIVLLGFNETLTDRFLLKTDRTEADRLNVFFTYGSDTLPRFRGLDFDDTDAFVIEASPKNDTITYWLRDTTLINRDTLTVELTYMMTDTTGLLREQTDTLAFMPKLSYERRQKLKEKEIEKWEKEQEKLKKKDLPYDSVMPQPQLQVKLDIPSSMSPLHNVLLDMPAPLARLDTAGVHLYSQIDTLWYRSRFEFEPVEGTVRSYRLRAEWKPGVEYSLEIDSAAFEDIYGRVNHPIKKGIRIANNDEFGSLFINLSGVTDTCVVVQMLNSSDKVQRSERAVDGTAEFYYIKGGKYYLRAFVDRNGNGIWDTGNYASNQQPEDVYYSPRIIECKAKWDVTIDWNLTLQPRDRQKPLEITKQKPDKDKKRTNRNKKRAEDLGIEYNPNSM